MKTKISTFLKERPERFKPEEANKLNLKRLQKIDFSGNMHFLEDKKTNTNMILIKPGDLVISGINVEKGAVAVYQGDEEVLATIHYSSYEFDKNKIDIEYFKWFLKSDAFRKVVQSQTRGGIKTELKPKKFLPLEIDLPDIKKQREILNKINKVKREINQLRNNIFHDKELLNRFKQAILSEAVQGKLVKQNSEDEPATELLKKMEKEKEKLIKEGKIKKGKELPTISDDEIPYDLPKGWVWCRSGEVCWINPRNNGLDNNLEVAFIPMNLIKGNARNSFEQQIKKWGVIKSGFTHFAEEDVIFAKITPCFQNRNSAILRNLKNKYGAGTTELYVLRGYGKLILPEFLFLLVNTKNFIDEGVVTYKGTAGQQRIKRNFVENYIIGLPPLAEQKRIVEKVDALMKSCDELENKIKESSKNSQMLMNSILTEVFMN
ncbi:restriction endonuclease subunit S [Candidatus Pacearchaeota archaeon]|nr:restriction endonuclease subunit S [Candidatus Pacearchaeota archaeon]